MFHHRCLWGFLCGLALTQSLFAHGVPDLQEKLDALAKRTDASPVTVTIPNGTYHFYFDQGIRREVYISNHDQANPKSVGIVFENLKNVTLDGSGSELIFHGKMIPILFLSCENCTLKNFHIDFADPSICQVKILENTADCITMEVAAEHEYEVEGGTLFFRGSTWRYTPGTGIAFDGQKRNLVYRTSDVGVNLRDVREIRPRVFVCPNWKNERLVPGTVFAMRPFERPAPGIFMFHDTNSTLENIQVHYAEGMGLLAQLCDGIHLDRFSVCLRGANSARYFTTQADATHFSGCKGLILAENGLYESMMDDAINVHGTYLKVQKRVDDRTLIGQYMHPQAWGFHWGDVGDDVQFIRSNTMEVLGGQNVVESIRSLDKETSFGAKEFEIRFRDPVPAEISEAGTFGIENLTWTPEVVFRNNVIRNNRARGALFSTPRKTLVEDNLFDHTSGTAILLCGDCNGWFETGACRDVLIRRNKFVNALTCMFQFTNGIISIYPEIPDLSAQKKYFHGGREDAIRIEDNVFETFDRPILYAKSVSGLTFRNNKIRLTRDFAPFHWNQNTFFFERVENYKIESNDFDTQIVPTTEVR